MSNVIVKSIVFTLNKNYTVKLSGENELVFINMKSWLYYLNTQGINTAQQQQAELILLSEGVLEIQLMQAS